jgi:hypothetical protein
VAVHLLLVSHQVTHSLQELVVPKEVGQMDSRQVHVRSHKVLVEVVEMPVRMANHRMVHSCMVCQTSSACYLEVVAYSRSSLSFHLRDEHKVPMASAGFALGMTVDLEMVDILRIVDQKLVLPNPLALAATRRMKDIACSTIADRSKEDSWLA